MKLESVENIKSSCSSSDGNNVNHNKNYFLRTIKLYETEVRIICKYIFFQEILEFLSFVVLKNTPIEGGIF